MNPELLKLLGLTAEATDEQVKAAIEKLKAGPAAELEQVKDELETTRSQLKATETDLANARKASPSLDKYVPRSDYDAVVARAKALEDEKKAGEEEARAKAVASAIDEAMKAGKIAPASKDAYTAMCASVEGFQQFQDLVKTIPTIGAPSRLETDPPPIPSNVTLTAEEKDVARQFGLTDEEYAKEKAAATREAQGA